jgi:tRNA (guanine37-N1)-methyltransferase
MRFHIITLFPGAFDSYIGESIISRAIADKKISVAFYNPRDFSNNKFKHVDQKPYAGGPGMVIQALPVIKAVEAAVKKIAKHTVRDAKNKKILGSGFPVKPGMTRVAGMTTKIIWLTPAGSQFDTSYAKKSAQKYTDIIIICGRYEGIDARVKKAVKTLGKLEEVSVGPFVVTGGELPAMIILDCVSRQIEGVLGNFDSREEERVASHDSYTRPEVIEYKKKKYRVPKVLLSGDHKKIEAWRQTH